MKYTKKREMLVNKLLKDPGFQSMVEQKIGFVSSVKVNWKTNEIIAIGAISSMKWVLDEIVEYLENNNPTEGHNEGIRIL